ncbi:MAG: chain length determinant protein EpsF [Zoogloeaceae bacterium]|jgi:chain length determinant protein EpsF|nr:chain length determinant protein EpsF [Zoogloeaceae bacterium]
MNLQQFLLILWAWRKLVLFISGLTVITTLVISLLLPSQYTATVTVVLDVKSPDPIVGTVLPGMMSASYMATQIDIINSPRVAQQVVRMVNMAASPQAQELWQDATGGRGNIEVWLAQLLLKNLDVRPGRESNVITINFTNVNPDFSAAIANTFAQSYINTNIELRVDPARQYASWFDTQIKRQRDVLEKAQKALSDYQQRTGIVMTDERLDFELQRLNTLSAQLGLTQAEKADNDSRLKQLHEGTLPELLQNPLLNQMKALLASMEAKLTELSGNLGKNHPQYQRAEAEIETLRTQLASETARVLSTIQTTGHVLENRMLELQQALEEQKRKVLALRKQYDEINVLLRDVETAQQAYNAVSQRQTLSDLEAQSVQTNIAVLTPAIAPLKPSSPRLLLNLAVAIFLGILLAIGSALAMELSRRQVRSAQDMLDSLDLPLLAQLDSGKALRSRHSRWRFWQRKPSGKRLPASA